MKLMLRKKQLIGKTLMWRTRRRKTQLKASPGISPNQKSSALVS